MFVGANAGGRGVFNLNGGSLAATGIAGIPGFSGPVAAEVIGESGIGIFNQTGGTNVAGSLVIFAPSGVGSVANLSNAYNLSGGSLSSGTIQNSGTFNYSGGSLTGNFINWNGAAFNISGSGTMIVNGNLTNNGGTITVTANQAQFLNVTLASGTYNADPSTNIFQTLDVGAAAYITGVIGDVFKVNGNFQNLSTQNSLWNTSAAELDFTGGGLHTFNLAGQNGAGFSNNFAWNILSIGAGNKLNLGAGSGDALYVNFLQGLVISGNLITNIDGAAGLFLYYNPVDNPFLSGNYSLTGGGQLIAAGPLTATPEPSSIVLMITGLAALLGYALWRKRAATARHLASLPS